MIILEIPGQWIHRLSGCEKKWNRQIMLLKSSLSMGSVINSKFCNKMIYLCDKKS